MCEPLSDCDSVSTEKSEFRPSLKYLLTGWRLGPSQSSFPFNDSQERKLCKIIFESWKSRNYMTSEQFQLAAYRLAKANCLKVHPRWEKCGRASDKWLRLFLRRHRNMRGMLIGKQGVPPKRKSNHSEGDFQSDVSSDFGSSDGSDSGGRYSDSEPEYEESSTEAQLKSSVIDAQLPSGTSTDIKKEIEDERT